MNNPLLERLAALEHEQWAAWTQHFFSNQTPENLERWKRQAHDDKLSVAEFVQDLGLKRGVTGYAYHTVPVALYAWLKHYGDYRVGLEAVLNCGGDTDTVGAITGALLAINSTIPAEWVTDLCDYPISTSYLEHLAHALESHSQGMPANQPTFAWIALPFRNLLFLIVVLTHVCLRVIF
jgi:ADP-ribosylglycohydrolase